jgi:TRAP-type C4-dicarboxylate transport system permease small subunit
MNIRKMCQPFDRTIEGLLVLSMLALLLFSLLTMIFRWTQVSALWVDPLVRHLVFLNIFLGGIIACHKGQHIGIDIAGKLLEGKGREKLRKVWLVLIALISALGSFALSYSGYLYFVMEQEYGQASALGIHSAFLVAIIPSGFFLIGLRFFLMALSHCFDGEA